MRPDRSWIDRLNLKGMRLTEKPDWITVTISQDDINDAIEREKEIKLMGRETKMAMIKKENPKLLFKNFTN